MPLNKSWHTAVTNNVVTELFLFLQTKEVANVVTFLA